MKSIKINPNSAKGPDKGKIVNKLHCILLTTKLAESSFLCRFRIESVNVFVLPRFDLCHVLSSSTNNFAHAQMLSRMCSLSGRMNIVRVNIECFTGCKRINQRRISFVLSYLRMILWKISDAISIKHPILATLKKKIYSDWTSSEPLFSLL